MKKIYRPNVLIALVAVGLGFVSCDDADMGDIEVANAPYVMSLGITSSGSTTYYVVSAENLMSGNVNAIGKGIEQNGYHDYQQAEETIFSIGGMGVTKATGIQRGTDGMLTENGNFVFGSSPAGFCQVDANTMVAMEMPSNKVAGSKLTFYTVDIKSLEIIKTVKTTDVAPLDQMEWPSVTGMTYSGGNLYVTYTPMSTTTYQTPYTDTCYVAVYSYPDMQFMKLMKDTRFGPGGSWNAFNGLLKTEGGDVYVMSNSAIANGYSQSTKHAGFLHIKAGETDFDSDYSFDVEELTGLKPAHVQYIGNGLVFAEVSTLSPQTANDRWGDKSLKCCIIDLYNKSVTDVDGIPVHNGNGGRRFAALVEGNYVYLPVSTSEGIFVYRTDVRTAKSERGAKISATFVGGLFKM